MNGKVTQREYESLSAYLDGELNPRECAHLDEHLKANEALRQELAALKRTRLVLRSQPRVRAPRNFTLSAQMAGVKSKNYSNLGAYPILRLASILATVFLVVIVAGDLLGSSMQPSSIALSESPQQAPLTMPGFGKGGGGGGDDSVGSQLVPSPTEIAAEAAMLAPTEVPSLKAVPEESVAEAEPALSQQQPAIQEQQDEPVSAAEAPLVGVPEPEGRNLAPQDSTEAQTRQGSWPFIRLLQGILALLALVTGLAALYLRRSLRR